MTEFRMLRMTLAGAIASTLIGPASAHKWGYAGLLCLAAPGGPTQYSACVPPVTWLWPHLRRGGGFLACAATGASTWPIGSDPSEASQDGYIAHELECDGAALIACVSSKLLRDCERGDEACQPHDIQAVQYRAHPNVMEVAGSDGPSTWIRL